MTNPRYQQGCPGPLQEPGKNSARWVVNFNNGNVNDNHRNNNACVRAVRAGEYHGEGEVTLQALHSAWQTARKGKQPSRNQLTFDARWADNLIKLQELINTGRWHPRPSACFVAERPKAREIHAPDFADRVVHHWLVPQLEAIWEPKFIHDSYANRRGKGSHAAVKRLQSFVRQVHSGQKGGWYLQLDIHNFFNSIHRPTLWKVLKHSLMKATAPATVLQVTHSLLRRHPLHPGVRHHSTRAERNLVPKHKRLENTGSARGLPIGNLSSQFFANVYLNKLDQFVKHTLKARRYLRYVDDCVIVHHSRKQLEIWLDKIREFIAHELRLSLKPDIRLKPLADGIDFLGYVVRPTHTLVRKRVVAHAKQTLSQWQQGHVQGAKITATPAQLRHIKAVAASFQGHCQHANTHRLQAAISQQFPWLKAATTLRTFHHQLEGQALTIPVINITQGNRL